MTLLALDIGGANLKVADGLGYARSQFFSLWKYPDRLVDNLRRLVSTSPACDHLAITMTGELADCFSTKNEGVEFILEAVVQASEGRHTHVYFAKGTLVTPQVALASPQEAAAANWHALAMFSGRYIQDQSALLIDIGSTTCDIIPLEEGKPIGEGGNDTQRMIHGELVYSGIARTPICGLVRQVDFRGKACPVAREVFGTSLDVYLTLDDLPEDPQNLETADGRPATKAAARDRLARTICTDRTMFSTGEARVMALAVARAQTEEIHEMANRVVRRLSTGCAAIVISGQGEFLARRVAARMGLENNIISLAEQLGDRVSSCAAAHAVAVLAREAVGL